MENTIMIIMLNQYRE